MSKRKVTFEDGVGEFDLEDEGPNKKSCEAVSGPGSRFKGKHSLDSDEEDDGEDTNNSKYNILDNDDVEGQEGATIDFDEGVSITPFNLEEEMQEGHFDSEGNYFIKKETQIRDNWLDNIDWVKIKEQPIKKKKGLAAKRKRRVGDEDEAEEEKRREEQQANQEDEEEEEVMYHQRKRARGGGSARRKKGSSVSEQEVGVSDSFGVSSYQDGEDSETSQPKRPTYSQPSIMPRKQWVVVKTERSEDDDLIVVSGEEGGEDEEDEDEREMELAQERERGNFNISNIRNLSAELGGRAESDMDSQMDYCQSSEDYLKFEGGLMEQTLAQHLHDSSAGQNQNTNRAVSALLGQVQSAASARAQLFPLDMQGNQILLYSQASGQPLDPAAAPPLGTMGGASFKGPSLEHGAVHLQPGLGVEGSDSGGVGGGCSGSSSGGSAKVFMCHCGKTFTHKSMRDRHINMHLDLRPFHCPVCSKKFKMKHHLTEHMKTHTGLKPYDCLGCGKKFMWRDSFMRHRSHCERRGGPGEA
uniref:Zinc finger and BTB domain containing 22b n=1 Tax=Nothobranchius kadleci TaxID=1051664 RepID=A0A1A8D112_NOTKA